MKANFPNRRRDTWAGGQSLWDTIRDQIGGDHVLPFGLGVGILIAVLFWGLLALALIGSGRL